MAKKLRILVDVDDTMIELQRAWLAELYRRYGVNVKESDICQWDVCKYYPDQTREQVFAPLTDEGFWKTVEPREDAQEYVKDLIEDGHDVILCTATDYRNVKAKYELVRTYFPFVEWENFVVTSRKQLIDADILIDDNQENIRGGRYSGILLTKPYNKYIGRNYAKNLIARADDWFGIYCAVRNYEWVKKNCKKWWCF